MENKDQRNPLTVVNMNPCLFINICFSKIINLWWSDPYSIYIKGIVLTFINIGLDIVLYLKHCLNTSFKDNKNII